MAYLGNAPAEKYISFERQVFTIVNSQTAYTLSHSVTNENDIRLVVNNIVQEPGSGKAYTATGTTLTLSAALTNGTDEMYCVFLGRAVGTVNAPAGSVGTSQLASEAVTNAKVASSIITGQTAETSIATDDLILLSDTSASGALKKMTRANFVSGVGGTNTPFFIARKTSDQVISDAATTKLTFEATDTESSSGVFDLTNNKFTVTEAGKYNISINVYHYDSTNDILRSDGWIYKNGSAYAQWINDRGSDQDERGLQVGGSIIMNLSVNDYIEAYARADQSDGGSTNIEGSASLLLTYLSGFKLIT